MNKFECTSIEVPADTDSAVAKINELGMQGWQMVQIGPPYIQNLDYVAAVPVARVWFSRETSAENRG